MRLLLAAVIAAIVPIAASADDAPTVLVQTQTPRQGDIPNIITAYGSAAPALDGGMTLSLMQTGRVTAIAVTPGETVHAGQRLIDFGASASTVSTYQQAVTALALARTERAHTASLLAGQLATRDQLAQSDKAVTDAQATLDALRREGADRVAQTLTAPFDGIVSAIPVNQGDLVQPGAPLLTLTRLDGLVVTVGIEPGDRGRVHPGQAVQLQRLAGGPKLAGRVMRIDGVLNPKTRLVDADISVPAGAVLSGEAFQAAITVGQLQGWVVPRDAVLNDGNGDYLFQISNGKAARVTVSVVGTAGDSEVVRGTVDPTRQLVIQGNYQLGNGAAVREANGK